VCVRVCVCVCVRACVCVCVRRLPRPLVSVTPTVTSPLTDVPKTRRIGEAIFIFRLVIYLISTILYIYILLQKYIQNFLYAAYLHVPCPTPYSYIHTLYKMISYYIILYYIIYIYIYLPYAESHAYGVGRVREVIPIHR
jgi:hypothetical protein